MRAGIYETDISPFAVLQKHQFEFRSLVGHQKIALIILVRIRISIPRNKDHKNSRVSGGY